jgi:hypothetical protein
MLLSGSVWEHKWALRSGVEKKTLAGGSVVLEKTQILGPLQPTILFLLRAIAERDVPGALVEAMREDLAGREAG